MKRGEVRDTETRQAMGSKSFMTHTIPEVFDNTRVIAVCGITDERNPSESLQSYDFADPREDGWVFSDFYAFKQLLKGIGSSQVWITSEHPAILVKKYSVYLHGNPYQDRRCVLRQSDLNGGIASDILIAPRSQIHSVFLARLKEESDIAREKKEPLLVLIFSHGDEATHGIMLGTEEPQNRLQMAQFKNAVGSGVHATLLTTAFFSGGWAVNTDLNNYTILAAAGLDTESIAWNESQSIGRFYGSIYASTLIQAMQDEAQVTAARSPTQDSTFAEFAGAVYNTLFNRMDRFAPPHDIRFSAQDDDWARAWGARIGIPLIKFQERWESLPLYPATADPTSSLDRAVSNNLGGIDDLTQQLLNVPLDSTTLAQNRFGSMNRAEKYVKRLARMYLNSFPNSNNVASNTQLHGQLRGLLDNTRKQDWSLLQAHLSRLEYRLLLSTQATNLLQKLGLPLPFGKSCSETNMEEVELKMYAASSKQTSDSSILNRFRACQALVHQACILPGPIPERQGRPWPKPGNYLALAVMMSATSKSEAEENVKRLKEISDCTVRELKGMLDSDESIRARKREWYGSMGKRLRSLSPTKRAKR